MSHILNLIAERCPDGVSFESLRDVGSWYGGGTPSKQRPEYWQDGAIPWLSPKDMGRPIIETTEDYITEGAVLGSATKLVPGDSVAVVVRSSILDRVMPTALVPIPVTLNQDMKAVVARDGVLPGYIAHLLRSRGPELLRTARKTGGSVASIETPKLMAFRVPVPPLEVQREIVKVLDAFTKLEAELEAELEARRRQYEHYRDQLLTFPGTDGVRRTPMGELTVAIASGKNKQRADEGRYPVYGSTGLLGYCDHAAYSGDALLIARVGANAGLVNVVGGDFDVSDNTLVVRPTLEWNVRFAFHQLTKMRLNQHAVGGGQPLITGRLLKSLEITLPPLDEQRRIARVLDTFDALVNDLSIGLPAELNARRKQYEHYRDRLLTFREAA